MFAEAGNSSLPHRMYVKGIPFNDGISKEASPKAKLVPPSRFAALKSSFGFSPKTSAMGSMARLVKASSYA